MSILNPDQATREAEDFYRRVDDHGIIPVTVGGDHWVTTPVLRAIAGERSRRKGPINPIHPDLHSDTWPPASGTKHHAGAAFRIGVEEGLIDPSWTLQIGFHGAVASLRMNDWAREHFTIITLEDVVDRGVDWLASEVRRVVGTGPTYFSLDLDVLDLASAPAVTDPEVDGMTIRELFSCRRTSRQVWTSSAPVPLCFCPPLDNPGQITASTASAVLSSPSPISPITGGSRPATCRLNASHRARSRLRDRARLLRGSRTDRNQQPTPSP